MKVLIIEDEEAASGRLKKLIAEVDHTIEVVATLDSIVTSAKWLAKNPKPDLILADIQLADGPSFEIFRSVKPECPVIFITAYDQFALQAFRFNGIDYLLKPVRKSDLEESFRKFRALRTPPESLSPSPIDYQELARALQTRQASFQKRIVVKIGQNIRMLEIADVAYFYSEEKITFAKTHDGKKWPLDFALDELETILDPTLFFRINRQFIIYIRAIDNMVSYSKSRVKIQLKPASEIETIVSAEKSPLFREWLLGKG